MENEKKGFEALGDLKKNSFLPPISTGHKVEFLSDEDSERSRKISDERKKFVMEIGKEKLELETALNDAKTKIPNWEELDKNDPVRVKIEGWEARLEEIESLDSNLAASVEFNAMIELIKQIDQYGPAKKMLDHLEKERAEGIRLPSIDEIKKTRQELGGKYPEGALVCPLNGKTYFQDVKLSGRARLLNKVVRVMIKKATASKIKEMAESASHNLTGLRHERIIPGKYYIFSPYRKTEKNGRFFTYRESHTVVEIFDDNKGKRDARPFMKMRIVDAFMETAWMLEMKKSFPLSWFEKGHVFDKEDDRHYSKEEKEHIGDVIRVLNGILHTLRNQNKTEAAAPKDSNKNSQMEAPSNDVIPAKFDRTIEGNADGEEVKVFVKPKNKKEAKAPAEEPEPTA